MLLENQVLLLLWYFGSAFQKSLLVASNLSLRQAFERWEITKLKKFSFQCLRRRIEWSRKGAERTWQWHPWGTTWSNPITSRAKRYEEQHLQVQRNAAAESQEIHKSLGQAGAVWSWKVYNWLVSGYRSLCYSQVFHYGQRKEEEKEWVKGLRREE